MMGHAFPGVISHTDAVVAPALTVMAIILFMGKVSGAHLNPAVSFAFALRQDFPWRRVPGYIVVQLAGATLAALCSCTRSSTSRRRSGRTMWPPPTRRARRFWMEFILTVGLVSVILGTASGAQNVGLFGGAGCRWLHRSCRAVGQPDLGCLDEPRPHIRDSGPRRRELRALPRLRLQGRSPELRSRSASAFVLRGRGGGASGSGAGQGALFTEVHDPGTGR